MLTHGRLCCAFLMVVLLHMLEGKVLRSRTNGPWSLLKESAKTFGQSQEERDDVVVILHEVNEIISSRYGINDSTIHNVSRATDLHMDRTVAVSKSRTSRDLRQRLRRYKQVMKRSGGTPGRFFDGGHTSRMSELSTDYFQGDIVLWKEQATQLLDAVKHENDPRQKRKFIRSEVRRWDPHHPIEYSFDGSHSAEEQVIIELALEHWQNITCLDFVRKDTPPTGSRIVFTDVDGCASNVGMHPLGEPQFVSIGAECLRLGVIAHEVAHALGFWHEQSRPDRDEFVNVAWENIDYGQASQFSKETPEDVESAGIPYDYGSIMHYRSKAFSRNKELSTITTSVGDYQHTIGQRDQLSFYDIKLMNTIYCRGACPKKLPCQRGGYTDPRNCDRCRCPDGFAGALCELVMESFGAPCGGTLKLNDADTVEVISSPHHPAHFREGQECTWLVQAPKNMFVQLQFTGIFEMYCNSEHALCMDYVEIRNTSDFANTGMRYCCGVTPQGSVVSETNEMLVLLRSFYRSGRGFRAKLRAVAGSERWMPWSSWSECSQSCGGCGVRHRQRGCAEQSGVCLGNSVETEHCNAAPCSYCAKPRRSVVPCGLWGLFRCEKLSEAYLPCSASNQCCGQFELQDDTCVPKR